MNFRILSVVLFILFTKSSLGQLDQGNWLVGGSAKLYSYSNNFGSTANSITAKYTEIDISPNVGYYQKETTRNYKTIRMTKIIPIINNMGKVDNYATYHAFITFRDDIRLYETPYHYDSIINNKVIKSEVRYKIFVHHKDSLFGRIFDPGNNIYNLRTNLDSFISIKSFSDLRLMELFENENLVMQSSEKDPTIGTYKEVYLITSKQDISKTGLAIFYYDSRLTNIDFSYSKELDSIHKMKLCEVIIQTNAHTLKENSMKIDTLKFTNKMELLKEPRAKIIKEYADCYLSTNIR